MRATFISRNHGPDVASLRVGRSDQGWIGHFIILFQDLLHVIGIYPYADIFPCPGFALCIPGSGSVCIPDSVRQFLVRAMPVSITSSIYIPDTSSVMFVLFCFGYISLGSLDSLAPPQYGEMSPPNSLPLFIGLEAPSPPINMVCG